jgi:quinol monooxygenase YgiN
MTIGGRIMATLGIAMLAMPAQAQSQMPAPATAAASAPAYVVTFLETGAASAQKASAVLRDLTTASRRAIGSAGFVALAEVGRPGRFATLETWRNKAALDADETATKAYEARLQPLLIAPPDRRPSVALDLGPAGATAGGSLYVLTHVDVIPPKKDEAIGLLKALAPASRKQPGAERFDVLQQISRPNHSFIVEVWRDDPSRDAHVAAAPTRQFRAELLPLQGSLYDERVYRPIP